MTPKQAAALIGITPQQVRTLIRAGELRAKRRRIPGGYVYKIEAADARRIRDNPSTRGWARGRARK